MYYKTSIKAFTSLVLLTFFIVFISVSCIIVNPPQETKGSENVSTETSSIATASETSASTTGSTDTTTTESTQDSTSSDTASTTTSTNQDTNLTQQEAIDIALTAAQGTVDRVETEIEHGKLVWKVRIVSGETRTDIRIDDATGTVVEVKTSND